MSAQNRQPDFNPNSPDAVISRILEQVEGIRQDFKESREETKKQHQELEVRVRKVEDEQAISRGKTIVLAVLASVGLSAFAATVARGLGKIFS